MLNVNLFVVVYVTDKIKFECGKSIKNRDGFDGFVCDVFVCNKFSKDCPNCKYHGYDKNAEFKPLSDDEAKGNLVNEMFAGNTCDEHDFVEIDWNILDFLVL